MKPQRSTPLESNESDPPYGNRLSTNVNPICEADPMITARQLHALHCTECCTVIARDANRCMNSYLRIPYILVNEEHVAKGIEEPGDKLVMNVKVEASRDSADGKETLPYVHANQERMAKGLDKHRVEVAMSVKLEEAQAYNGKDKLPDVHANQEKVAEGIRKHHVKRGIHVKEERTTKHMRVGDNDLDTTLVSDMPSRKIEFEDLELVLARFDRASFRQTSHDLLSCLEDDGSSVDSIVLARRRFKA